MLKTRLSLICTFLATTRKKITKGPIMKTILFTFITILNITTYAELKIQQTATDQLKSISIIQKNLKSRNMGGGQEGNGGGGIKARNRVMTFYSAQIEGQFDLFKNQPIIDDLIRDIESIEDLPMSLSSRLIDAIHPSEQRTYIDLNNIDRKLKQRLLSEYQRITSLDVSKIILFALTDTQSKTTYLLPEFYELTYKEQKSILIHEAAWILKPEANYKQIIAAEMRFQEYLEQPKNKITTYNFIKSIGGHIDVIQYALTTDLKYGYLDFALILDQKYISIDKLFGQDFIECEFKCFSSAKKHLEILAQKKPNSLFINLLSQLIQRNRISFLITNDFISNNQIGLSIESLTQINTEQYWNSETEIYSQYSYYTKTSNRYNGYTLGLYFTLKSDFYEF